MKKRRFENEYGGQDLSVKNCRISEKRIWEGFEARDRGKKIETPKDDRPVLKSTRSRLPFGTTVRWRDMAANPTSATCFAEGDFGFRGGCGIITKHHHGSEPTSNFETTQFLISGLIDISHLNEIQYVG